MYQSQWHCYEFVTGVFNEMPKKNVGVCQNTGKTFRDFMQHFLLGLDKVFIMADAGINSELLDLLKGKVIKVFLQISECRCIYIIRECLYIIYVIQFLENRSCPHPNNPTNLNLQLQPNLP